jgi:hypothetical protein
MSTVTGRGPSRRWTWESLRYAVLFVPAICLCLAAGWFELGRARSGRVIAWVYVGEWPLYGVLLAYMWWRIVTDRPTRRPSPPEGRGGQSIPDDDPGLQAWRAYLEDVGHDASTDRAPGSG